MCVAANTCNTSYPEIERRNRILPTLTIGKPGLFKVRHDEAAEATVDVKTYIVRVRERTERHDIVLITVREVNGRAYELWDALVAV